MKKKIGEFTIKKQRSERIMYVAIFRWFIFIDKNEEEEEINKLTQMFF